DEDRRAVPRPLRRDREAAEIDIARAVELELRVAGDRPDAEVGDRDVARAEELEAADADAADADDAERSLRARAEAQRRIGAGPRADRAPAAAQLRGGMCEALRVPDGDRARLHRSGRGA